MIIQSFRESEKVVVVVAGNAGLHRLPFRWASLNVRALTTAHLAKRREGSVHPLSPHQTELFTKFPQIELL